MADHPRHHPGEQSQSQSSTITASASEWSPVRLNESTLSVAALESSFLLSPALSRPPSILPLPAHITTSSSRPPERPSPRAASHFPSASSSSLSHLLSTPPTSPPRPALPALPRALDQPAPLSDNLVSTTLVSSLSTSLPTSAAHVFSHLSARCDRIDAKIRTNEDLLRHTDTRLTALAEAQDARFALVFQRLLKVETVLSALAIEAEDRLRTAVAAATDAVTANVTASVTTSVAEMVARAQDEERTRVDAALRRTVEDTRELLRGTVTAVQTAVTDAVTDAVTACDRALRPALAEAQARAAAVESSLAAVSQRATVNEEASSAQAETVATVVQGLNALHGRVARVEDKMGRALRATIEPTPASLDSSVASAQLAELFDTVRLTQSATADERRRVLAELTTHERALQDVRTEVAELRTELRGGARAHAAAEMWEEEAEGGRRGRNERGEAVAASEGGSEQASLEEIAVLAVTAGRPRRRSPSV